MAKIDVLVLGPLALDSLETPFGKAENVLGGASSYAAVSSSFFAKTGIVGIVGNDFPEEHWNMLEGRGIDLEGVEKADGKTFFWKGKYGFDVNTPETLETRLGVLEHFKPVVPDSYKDASVIFLGNTAPEHHLSVINQMNKRPKLIISDTMNYWISSVKEQVLEVVQKSDIALMNDGEARQLFETPSIYSAAQKILAMDSKHAIIKKGEHGAVMYSGDTYFSAPGYPLEKVVDPTGCGDCFGGTLAGYLSQQPEITDHVLRKAIVLASTVSSFNAEGFSHDNLSKIDMPAIEGRYAEFRKIVEF
jgi:sugar/nucleoside kinase (ribokinase family)